MDQMDDEDWFGLQDPASVPPGAVPVDGPLPTIPSGREGRDDGSLPEDALMDDVPWSDVVPWGTHDDRVPLEEVVVHSASDTAMLTGPIGPGPIINDDPDMAVDVLSAVDEWADRLAFVRDLLLSTRVRGVMGETTCSIVVERYAEFAVPVTLLERFTTLPNVEHFADDEKRILSGWSRGFSCACAGAVLGIVDGDGMFRGAVIGRGGALHSLPRSVIERPIASSIRLMLAIVGGEPQVEVSSNIALGLVRREAARMGMAVNVKRRNNAFIEMRGALRIMRVLWMKGAIYTPGEPELYERIDPHLPRTKAYHHEVQRMMNRPRPPRITVHTPALTIKPDAECPICLLKIGPGEGTLIQGCTHAFHRACVMQWLVSEHSCPMCRGPATVATLLNAQPAAVSVFTGTVPFYRVKLDYATDRAEQLCAVVSKWGWIPRGLADRDARWTVHPPGGIVCNAWVVTRDCDADTPKVLCMDSVTPCTTLEAVAARRGHDLGRHCVAQVATSAEMWEPC